MSKRNRRAGKREHTVVVYTATGKKQMSASDYATSRGQTVAGTYPDERRPKK